MYTVRRKLIFQFRGSPGRFGSTCAGRSRGRSFFHGPMVARSPRFIPRVRVVAQWSVPFSGVDRSPLDDESAVKERRIARAEHTMRSRRRRCRRTRYEESVMRRKTEYAILLSRRVISRNAEPSPFHAAKRREKLPAPRANTHRAHDHRTFGGRATPQRARSSAIVVRDSESPREREREKTNTSNFVTRKLDKRSGRCNHAHMVD